MQISEFCYNHSCTTSSRISGVKHLKVISHRTFNDAGQEGEGVEEGEGGSLDPPNTTQEILNLLT